MHQLINLRTVIHVNCFLETRAEETRAWLSPKADRTVYDNI